MHKKIACILLMPLCLMLVLFTSCSKGPDTRANVMYVNGCAGTNAIYAWANKKKVTGAVNIYYAKSSNYQKQASGRIDINYYYWNTDLPLCNGSYLFNTGDFYSIFAGGNTAAPTFVVTTDDLTLPTAGNAKIRFINLSNGVPAADFSVGTQTLGNGVLNGECSPFYEVTAGSYLLKAANSTGQTADSVKLDAGLIYTAMLVGSQSVPTGSAALTLSVLTNR